MTAIVNENIDNATFLSGHVRSGTNLTMRLLDGTEGLAVPPGVGKLHILRRGLDSFRRINSDGKIDHFGSKCVEVAQRENLYPDFLDIIAHNSQRFGSTFGRHDIDSVVKAVFQYHEEKTGKSSIRWLEKNHNLEFFTNRALRSFSAPRFIIVQRDPRAVWVSWKSFCIKANLDLGPVQLKRNLGYMLIQEISEHFSGTQRFSSIIELLDHYCVSKDNLINVLNISTNRIKYGGIERLTDFIDISRLESSTSDVGAFCWGYNFLYDRANWVMSAFPNISKLFKYEEIITDPQRELENMCNFIDLPYAKSCLIPTEFGKSWSSNSSFDTVHGVINSEAKSHWRNKIVSHESAVIDNLCTNHLHYET